MEELEKNRIKRRERREDIKREGKWESVGERERKKERGERKNRVRASSKEWKRPDHINWQKRAIKV